MIQTVRQLRARGAAGHGICVDVEGATLGPDCVLVRRTANFYRCVSPEEARAIQGIALAPSHDPDWLFEQSRRICQALQNGETALAQIYGLQIPVIDLDDAEFERLARAASLAKANFDPNQPRVPKGEPDAGQWVYEPGYAKPPGSDEAGDGDRAAENTASVEPAAGTDTRNDEAGADRTEDRDESPGPDRRAAGSLIAADPASSRPLLGPVSPAVLAALARLAASLAVPTAFFGTLLIPSNRNPLRQGVFDGAPNVAYLYDRDTGVLRLTQMGETGNRVLLAEAHIDADGFFRDNAGDAIGRALPDGGIVIDTDALPGYFARPATAAPPLGVAGVQTRSEADNEPKLCPDPSPDPPGARAKNIAYQQYVSMLVNGRALPAGLAMSLWNPVTGKDVVFDDCRLSDGTMIDAKGPGYLKPLNSGIEKFPWLGVEKKMLKQAQSQIEAAQGRAIEWYVAEREVADRVRESFKYNRIQITVIHAPWWR